MPRVVLHMVGTVVRRITFILEATITPNSDSLSSP